jgi:hypothetical protein
MPNRIWPESDQTSVGFQIQASNAIDFCEVILRIYREANVRGEEELPNLRQIEFWADGILRWGGAEQPATPRSA